MKEFFKKLGEIGGKLGEDILPIVVNILLQSIKFIEDAEKLFQGAGQGKIKKEYVLNMVSVMLSVISFFKDNDEYREMILNLVSEWIDIVVATYNSFGGWGRKAILDIPEGTEV